MALRRSPIDFINNRPSPAPPSPTSCPSQQIRKVSRQTCVRHPTLSHFLCNHAFEQKLKCCARATGVSAAADGSASAWKHPLTAMAAGAPGVEILYWFPHHSRLQFPVGEKVRPPYTGLRLPDHLSDLCIGCPDPSQG